MPREIKTLEELTDEILNRTIEVYTKRSDEFVKFKLRTKRTLYTIKVVADKASDVENRILENGSLNIIPV